MKKFLFCSVLLLALAISGFSQVTIADWDGVSRSFSGYPAECAVTAPVANPSKTGINTSNNVMRVTTSADQYDIAYTNPQLPTYLNFTSANSITVKVYSDVAGKVWLKLGRNGTGAYDKVISGYYFTPGTWQEIKFNFYFTSTQNNIYNMISIFPDYEGSGENNWYFDDIKTVMVPSFTADIISDFDNTIRSFVKQDNATVTWSDNPSKTGINTSDKVMQIATTSLQYEGAMCLMEGKLDFTGKNTISLKVYSDVAGPVWLKIMNYSDQAVTKVASGYYFTPGAWQDIKFNFYCTGTDNDIYDAITVYPDYEQTGSGNWYIDDVNFTQIPPFDDDVISNFDNITRYFEDYTVNGVFFPVPNPNSDGVNNTPNCLKLITDNGKYENIKTTLESKFDFTNYKSNFINIMVYSGVTGKVLLKINGPEDEYIAGTKSYSTPNSWQQLSFDVTGLETETYNSVTMFPDYEGTGVADWYIDEIIQYHPIDINMYSNWDGVTLPFTQVGNSSVVQASNPAPSDPVNTSANVLSITTTSQTTEGAKTELDSYMDYSISAIYTVKIYSSTTGAVRMRLEGTGVPTEEVSVDYTTAGQWQLLTFDFGIDIATDVYNELSILPDYGSSASGTWYIDDLSGPRLASTPIDLDATYADWETISPTIETWLDMTTSVISNPLVAGINQSAYALQTNTNSGLYEGFAFTIPGVFDFSAGTTFALNVMSDQAGTVAFKIESAYGADPVEIQAQYTKPDSWQQLVYTFSGTLPSAYNKIAIFPDLGGTSASQWYFDNIQGPASIDRLIFLTGSIPEGREDGEVISVNLFSDTYVPTLTGTNWVATGLPAGVTIGSVNRVNDTLAHVTLSGNSSGQSPDDIIFTLTVDKDEFASLESDLSADMNIIAIGDFSETRQKRVFVHYMPWYNIEETADLSAFGGWRNPEDTSQIVYANEPLIGEYSQLDEVALEYHFLTMHAAGIDGIIVNINPSNNRDNILTKSILDKLAEMNEEHASTGFSMKYIISYDNKYLSPADYASIYNELEYVRDSLTNNPKYSAYRFNDDKTGNPVLITWSHLGDQDTSYHNALNDLFSGNLIHIKRDANDFASANATFQWINYLQANTPSTEHVYWGEDYFQDFETDMANQHEKYIPANQRIYLTMGGVWPGFDDSNALWGEDRWINRMVDAGETMALTFDRQINYVPGTTGPVKAELPWIQVITWNDWPEGATIEPATDDTYGYTALLTTMVKTAEYKGQAIPGNADSIGVTIPYVIYQARKSGDATYAQCVLDEFLAGNYETAFENCSPGFNILLDVPYSQAESGILRGAACAKMILDYEGTNSITQSEIQSYGTSQNDPANAGADFIDPYGMYRSLNHFELDYRYNYAQLTRNTRDEAYHDLCYWISYTIPNTPREHLPSVVPVNGGFNNWFVVDGFQSSADPHVQSDYTVYGFYITDAAYGGVGHKMFIQANTFSTYYFHPISSSDIWNGKYVSVNEPPEGGGAITVELEREIIEPGNNDLRFAIVEYAFNDYNLDNNSAISGVLSAGVQRDRIYFVDLEGTLYDYYIVTYSRHGDGDCIAVGIIDANNGALKLITYNEPDYFYYTYLDNYTDYTRLKSSEQASKGNNLLYPAKGSVSLMNEAGVNDLNEQESGFEIMPNPAHDFARVQYTITHDGLVNISIIDMSGKTIKTIVNNRQNAGNYNLETDVQGMDNGIYIVRMATSDKTTTKQLVICR